MYLSDNIFDKIRKLKQEGKYEEALTYVNSLLKKDPTNEDLLYEVTDIQFMMGELDKAEKPLDFLMKFKGDNNPMVYYAKWVIAMDKTDWETARKYLKKAVELSNYSNPEILRCYWLTEYWYWNKEKWIDFLEKAFDISWRRDAEIIYNLIEIYLLEHKYSKAQQLIDFFESLLKSWNLDTFDRWEDFYVEKIRLYKKFLEIIKKDSLAK